ncbi:hypothetical protein FHX77_000323 [Bifidobacterium commune]|uniref:KAP family P-loop domain-containing protein n=1 Tax=Bifidobacterium commune TaxID=1505727 RepID=A0A1C4H3A4_9BIFI|nr:P-loop NTPase fold protein [Bifidobacterium commune]MBB2954943.1 hypothetical protein [Bifidobacterium commune]SCC79098.1 KAP family P-loop domain-containing protein [Bifidobacterium commune]
MMRGSKKVAVEPESLCISDIDTSGQAEAFAKRIAGGHRTFFLQGSWGSGKTEYLEKVKKTNAMKNYRFIDLALWKPTNRNTLAQNLFSAIFPRFAKIIYGTGLVLLVFAVIGAILLALQGSVPVLKRLNPFTLPVTVISVVLTTLHGFLNSRWFDTDRFLLTVSIRSLTSLRRPKVLVIDDFDRLGEGLQKELYTLFNAVHGRTAIIFVGDQWNLKSLKDNYLGKIIDQKIMLPLPLQSGNVAQRIREAVAELLGKDVDLSSVETMFVYEHRTARDANRFLAYVEAEFIGQDKKDRVQHDQELFVIYLYLFHPSEYEKLYYDHWLPKKDSNATDPVTAGVFKNMKDTDSNEAKEETAKPLVEQYMDFIFQPRNTNPTDFSSNSSAYFINELANKHALLQLREAIDDEQILTKMFDTDDLTHSADYEEFLDYVDRMGDDEYFAVQSRMETNAISVMHSEVRHVPNRLVKLIFDKRLKQMTKRFTDSDFKQIQEMDAACMQAFESIFDEAERKIGITVSPAERMYCYRSCLNLYGTISSIDGGLALTTSAINECGVSRYFDAVAKRIVQHKDYGSRPYDAEALIVQLGFRFWLDGPINPTQHPDFQSKVESIEKLDPSEYRAFWKAYRIEPTKQNGKYLLQGGAALEFDYDTRPYDTHVLDRLIRERDE